MRVASQGRAKRDSGASFIEVLVSIVLLGTSGVAVLTAVGAAATGAATNRSLSEAQAAASRAADELTSIAVPFEPCASPGHYESRLPSELAVRVVEVRHWRAGAWGVDCDPATDTLQLVTVEAANGERSASTLRVVKRRPSDPDAEYVMNQDAGGVAPVMPTGPTPGIDGTTTTTSTTTTTTTTVPTPTPTTVAPTTVPERAPDCIVDRVRVRRRSDDSIDIEIVNDTGRDLDWSEWLVRLGYEGVGAEETGSFVSTWDGDVLTLTPASRSLTLRDGTTRSMTILEPSGSLSDLDEDEIDCEVVLP